MVLDFAAYVLPFHSAPLMVGWLVGELADSPPALPMFTYCQTLVYILAIERYYLECMLLYVLSKESGAF
jgi:hypothetical protein